jgi:hypothetical protein
LGHYLSFCGYKPNPVRKSYFKPTLFATVILLHAAIAVANTNTAINTGTWENGSNWSTGVAPVATDNVVVPAGFTITASAAGDLCASLTINASGTVIVKGTLSIGGSLTNAGTFTGNSGSTVAFNGAANSIISGGGTYLIFATIVMNMGSAATTLDIQDANFITGINSGTYFYFTFIRGTWIMDNTATLNNCINSGTHASLTIPYGVVIEALNGQMNLDRFGATDSVILSGELLVNGGIVNVQLGQSRNAGEDLRYTVNGGTPQLYVSSGTLYVGGGFNALNSTDYIDFNMTGGNIILAYNGYSSWITFQLADNVGGKTFMSGGNIILQDACNASIEDLDMGGANVAATLYSVTGGTVQLGYINTQSGATYFGIDAQPTTNYPNIQFLSGTAKNVSAWNGGQINMLSLYINPNMTYDASTGFTVTNIISTNGTFAFDDEGTFVTGNNTVEFSGSVNQPILSTTLSNIGFYNLAIANTSGNLTLGVNTTVNNQLSFTSGLLDASKKTLTIANGSVAATGASSSSYAIVGNGVSTTGNMTIDNLPAGTATAFPIGTASDYLPVSINPVNAGTNYSAYVFTDATTNGKSNGTAFSAALLSNMLNAIWNISQTAGSGSATLNLDWTPAESSLEGTVFALAGTSIGIIQNTGGTTWSTPSGTGNVATTYATASFNNFTQFAITDLLFVLPVAVYEFNAVLNNNHTVGLSWSASDEMDISQFEVQRSTDGTNYSPIGTVQANNAQSGYSFIDPHPAAVNYYRLLTTINDGSTVYSPVRTIDLSSAVAIAVYPVPATTTLNVSVGNAGAGISVRIINVSGQVLQSSVTTGGSQVITMDISSYPAGTYFVQVIGENKVLQITPLTKL